MAAILAAMSLLSLLAALPDVNVGNWRGEVKYEIWMPGSDDPIVRRAELTQYPSGSDTLAPCEYLIVGCDDSDKSFAAYFDGNFIRFRNDKMVEWNITENPAPFAGGVHRTEMYAPLLPAFVNEFFRAVESDTAYTYTVSAVDGGTIVKGSESRRGYLMKEFEFKIGNDGSPISSEITINPGATAEQIASATYTTLAPDTMALTEEKLVELFPDIFERFSAANFTIDSLIGRHIPSFSLPSTGKSRVEHRRGEPFARPTLIVVADEPESSLIAEARLLGQGMGLIYVFDDTNAEAIMERFGQPNDNESVAFNGRSLISDCGIKELPALIYVDSEGIVEKTQILNKITP